MAEELPQNDRSTNNSEKEVIEARDVFLLMKNEYRISRNTRASWYFSHINSRIDYTPKTDINDFQEELGILSITARDEQGIEYVPCGQHLYKLTPDIQVTFIALRYRLVFILDVSPSIATVDLSTSEVLYDEAFKSLEIAMKCLVQPFHVPGSQILLCPELYVTVIAHTPLVNCKANQVLMQGCLLTQKNVDNMLRVIGKALTRFEDKVAQALMEVVESDTYQEEEEEHLTGGLFEDIVEKPDTPNPILYLTSPDMSFVNLFRYGILALQLLPEKSAAGIIVITDGVVGLPEASLFESLMGQLRHSTISCSFIQIGEDFKHNAGLGHVPYSDMLSYMATSTFGTLFTRLPQLDKTSNEMNIFHQEILAWSLQKPLHQMQVQNSALLWTSLNPIMHKKHVERNLHTPISNLISCRLREGYTIQDVHLTKGDSQIEVNMVLLWRDQITILYLAVATWPLSAAKRTTHIEVSVLAHYAFLQDVTCPGKKLFSSPYRTALVKKYWQTLQGTSETDQLLVHLQSFAMSPVYYLVPESVKKGVPLFFLLANSTTPQLNVQLSSKDASLTQFANFWKPVLMLDINIWQKWMHTHRIGLILMHDIPLGKHLHIPNSSGRFHSIMCRQAQMSLNNLLRDWSTFELLENHSYIKLLFQDPDKPPTSFYLLRVSPKPPCMVLRLAFLGGMSGKQRNEIVSQLTEKITGLTFPQRGTQKDNKQKKSSQQQLSQENLPSPRQHKPPLQIPWSDTPCCVYCHKPLEKILIRYDRMPHDFFVLDVPPMIDQSGQLSYPVSANKTAANVFTTLSRYLYHRRWVWTMQHASSMPISMQAVGCMLSNLTKIRLQEGFRFSHASSGIVDMVLEVAMKLPCVPTESESADTEEELHPCIVQYVIFPPHTATTKESASKDDMEEMETTEADGELQIITECWVEPQCGVIVNSTPERQHFDGLNYIQLAQAMYPTDLGCISTMLTFEHLSLLCKSDLPSLMPLDLSDLTESFHQASPQEGSFPQQTAIRSVPFAFDILGLLSKCQQVELLFSTCIQDPHETSHTRCRRQSTTGGSTRHNVSMDVGHPNSTLFSLLLDSLHGMHDREIQLTNDQCDQLIDLITQRDRDLQSYPLPIGRVRPRLASGGETGESFDESSASVSTSFSAMSVKSQLKTGQSDNISQSDSSKHHIAPRTPLVSPRTKVKGQDDHIPLDKPGVGRCAKVRSKRSHDKANRWSCFVKSVNGSHMIFSFIPSSYDDLCSLAEAQKQEKESANYSTDHTNKKDTVTVTSASSPCAARTEGDSVNIDIQDDDIDMATSAICSCPSIPSGHISVPLPLYVYNCPVNFLSEQLVNRWTYTRPPDIFEDLTFKVDELHSSLMESCPGHKRGPMEDGCEPTSPGGHGDRGRWSEGDRRSRLWTEREEAGAEDVYGEQLELRNHCRQLSDTFLRCFVSAIFSSLQQGADIDCHDIEAAINNICEESTPLEIDITHFVYSVCGHVRQLIEKVNLARIVQEDIMKTFPKSMSKDDDTSAATDEASHAEDVVSVSSQNTDLTNAVVLQFPLAILQGSDFDCEAATGLHALIRDKFDTIMAKSFKPVPSNPDFYYYCLSAYCEKQRSSESEKVPSDEPETDQKVPTSDENEVFIEDYIDEGEDELSEHFSVISNRDSGTLDDVDYLADFNDDNDDVGPPLFLYLTCSVRSKRRSLKSIPVRNLPICLSELKECLGDLTSEVNLSDLQITLDIICLMLPPETDVTEQSSRPCYYRMTSHMSQMSYMSTSPPASDVLGETDDLTSLPTTTDAGYTRENLTDPLSGLPSRQHQAVTSCKEQILWLLQDEIASASRLILPVAAETLAMVADHVKRSDVLVFDQCVRPMCSYEQVPLHFVYGPDSSLTQFIEDFERMHLPGYHLNKEGAYYYLYLNRMHAHVQAISSKLEHLEVKSAADVSSEAASGTVPDASDTTRQKLVSEVGSEGVPGADDSVAMQCVNKDAASAVLSDAEVLVADVCDGMLTKSGVSEVLMKDAAEENSVVSEAHPVVVKEELVETDAKEETVEGCGQEELAGSGGKEQTSEFSTELGAAQFGSEVTASKDAATVSVTDDQKGAIQGKDIKISIIRPSPVRQVPKKEIETSPRSDVSLTQAADQSNVVADTDVAPAKKDKAVDVHEVKPIRDIAKTVVLPPVVLRRRHRSGEPVSQSTPLRELSMLERRATLDGSNMVWASHSLQQLQVCTPSGSSETLDKAGMKRIHSAATLEKYRHDKLRKSGLDTSDPHTPARSRNQSGLQTPKSTSLVDTTSSRSSVGEEGYEGDSSDLDEEGVMMSFSESLVQRPVLPNFWLIMRIYPNVVDVFFHARDNDEDDRPEYPQQKMLNSDIIKNIRAICRAVNQRGLLQELNDTHMCNLLLVPEADEDIRWTQDKFSFDFPKHKKGASDSDESDDNLPPKKYLAAMMEFKPGHFACECVWRKAFLLHSRLKMGPGRSGISRGIQALRSILNKFSVNNRKNMFVFRENNGSVFYLRLNESPSESMGGTPSVGDGQESIHSCGTFSRSSSIMSLPVKKQTDFEEDIAGISAFRSRRLSSADHDGETSGLMSPSSRSATYTHRRDDVILLSAYGICPVSAEISEDLVEVLQKKLNDAVLDVITVTLSRNPMCKLSPDDVQFIQPPGPPPHTLRLLIPGSAMLQQFALGYYLRQNLLQFTHTPKYTENKPENVFKEYSQEDHPVPILEEDVFLYNTPQQARGKGIACLHLQLVDGRGRPVQLLGSRKPLPLAYKDPLERSMFDNMVSTSVYEPQPNTKSPGPPAVVQINMWQQGDVVMSQLTDRLILAMKHAVCDIIMEYRLLTAPLCEVPEHYVKGVDSPLHSAPPSPVLTHSTEPCGVTSAQILKKQSETGGGKTPKEKSSFSFQSLMSRMTISSLGKESTRVELSLSGGTTCSSSHTWHEVELQRQKEDDIRQKIVEYERGSRGTLQPLFCGCMQHWLHYCTMLEAPSVSRFEYCLYSRFPIDYVLKELQTIVTGICQDIVPKVFRQLDMCMPSDSDPTFLPYTPSRMPMCSQDYKSESSLDLSQYNCLGVPGRTTRFIVVGRNVQQWQMSIDYSHHNDTMAPDLTHPKTNKNYQRFKPLEYTPVLTSSPDKLESVPSNSGPSFLGHRADQAFVPRQRFLLIEVQDKEFMVYTYNWSQELNLELDRQMTKQLQWQNARSHLLTCIVSQKMGLFQHNLFCEPPPDPQTQLPHQGMNPFTNFGTIRDLVMCTSIPPATSQQLRYGRGRVSSTSRPPVPMMQQGGIMPTPDDVFHDTRPPVAMHCKTDYRKMRDPVHRHGAQLLECRSVKCRESEKCTRLEKLYLMWQQRMGPSHVPIAEDALKLLKDSSRLIHNVATPLLFSAQWRKKLLNIPEVKKRHDSQNSTDKPRSRNSSGTSIKSRRSETADLRKRSVGFESPDALSKQLHATYEEAWHESTMLNFISQYILYLQSLSFVQVQTRPPSPKKLSTRSSSQDQPVDRSPKLINPSYTYLQKTLPGGIMLIELGFRDVYFCVNVYALECSRLPVGKTVNRQLAVIFTDECDKLKDLTHAHSFAHDFHLRTAQLYLSNRQPPRSMQGYYLTGFLHDFSQHFSYAPSFAQNLIYEGTVTIDETNSSGRQLFEYMLQPEHAALYNMRRLHMQPGANDDLEMVESALCTQLPSSGVDDIEGMSIKPDSYDIGLVISHDTSPVETPRGVASLDHMSLRLRYWVILTHRSEIFPKLKLERKMRMAQHDIITSYPATGHMMSTSLGSEADFGTLLDMTSDSGNSSEVSDTIERIATSKTTSVRQASINYLGYSNVHQVPMYALLQKEADRAREMLKVMVKSSMAQCRRDFLWNRMVSGTHEEVEGRRKHRSEPTDEARDPLLIKKLTFAEFEELLSFVTKVSLSDIDPTLTPLQNMSMTWYQSLLLLLRKEYTDTHRYFASGNNQLQYMVVTTDVNSFMMLAIDTRSMKTELCAVYRDQTLLAVSDTPSKLNHQARILQKHFEDFVNVCCYHLWSGILV